MPYCNPGQVRYWLSCNNCDYGDDCGCFEQYPDGGMNVSDGKGGCTSATCEDLGKVTRPNGCWELCDMGNGRGNGWLIGTGGSSETVKCSQGRCGDYCWNDVDCIPGSKCCGANSPHTPGMCYHPERDTGFCAEGRPSGSCGPPGLEGEAPCSKASECLKNICQSNHQPPGSECEIQPCHCWFSGVL